MQVNVLEAKNKLSQLIKAAQTGEEVVIANRGEPVVRLVPIHPTPSPGDGRLFLKWLDDSPLPEHAQRSAEEIEATVEQARSAWD
jgi:prevent-host-death family protein